MKRDLTFAFKNRQNLGRSEEGEGGDKCKTFLGENCIFVSKTQYLCLEAGLDHNV